MEQGAVSSSGNAGLLTADESTPCPGRQWPAYTYVMRATHWGTVAILMCTYAAAWAIDDASNAADRAWLIMLHRSLGLTLLLLTCIRLFIRQRTRIPPLPTGLPLVQRLAARASTILLYASLIMQPLLGLAASALHGDRMVLFGGLVLPRLLPEDRTLAHALFHLHGAAASVFLCLIGLHAAAALHHHFVRQDHVLAAMLPGLRVMQVSTGRAP